jgi:DNA repair protein RadC
LSGSGEACRRHLAKLLLPFGEDEAEALARLLISEFGSLAAVLAASPRRRDRLLASHGEASHHLSAIRGAMLHALRERALAGAEIAGTEALARYLRADMGYRPGEQIRILFLAAGNRLLADEVMMEGSIDSAALLPRPIVHRALDLGASGIILVHNHPGGSPDPSRADLDATRVLVAACRPLEIAVHDHLIVARGGWTSLRVEGLL